MVDGIRPTGDRVRETLFNWLAPWLPGARCLDLFAGSGALGIEALSRGAAAVLFIEKNPAATAAILKTLDEFAGQSAAGHGGRVLSGDALQTDIASHGPFDIVFVDPPFAAAGGATDLSNLCTLLENSGGLAAQCHVYLEMDREVAAPDLPAGWQLKREKTAGKVRYALAERNVSAGSTD